MARRKRWIVMTALGAVLVGGVLVDDGGAAAKPSFSATINGRVFKAPASTSTRVIYGATIVEVVAHTKKGRLTRDLVFVCVALNFPSSTFPLTVSQCGGQYQEVRISLHPSVKIWTTSTGLQATIDTFDGTHAQGMVSGTFEVPTVGTKAATVKNGKFSLPATTL